jgi:hypothetical protein
MHTIVHNKNRGMLKNNSEKTLYELWKEIPADVKHFIVFGSK